jgi:DNA-binding NtrC family response regulator
LLRVLQQRELTRVGGEQSLPVDVRVVSASHQNLAECVRAGKFRADLYYRLSGLTLKIPPLRERVDDIAPLAEAALRRLCLQWNLKPRRLSAAFLSHLTRYSWPGNVRELQHAIGQALLMEDGRTIQGHHFIRLISQQTPPTGETKSPGGTAFAISSRRERAREALRASDGNKSTAARNLGITRKSLYAWLART